MKVDPNYIMEKIKEQAFFCEKYLVGYSKPADFYFDYLSARVYTDNDVFVITPDTTNEELKNKMDKAINDAL